MDRRASIAIVLTLLVSTFTLVAPVAGAQPSSSGSQNVLIEGSSTLASASLDICSALHLGSCAISFSLTAQYTQPITLQWTGPLNILQPLTTETTQSTLLAGLPNLVLNFTFGLGNNFYSYPFPLPTLPVPGTYTYTIPLSQILSRIATTLGLGLLAPLVSVITLKMPITFASQIQAVILSQGFAAGQTNLLWNNTGTQSFNSYLTGSSDDSRMSLNNFSAIFSVAAQFIVGAPIIGEHQLYSFQTNLEQFGDSSSSVSIGDWFHVLVESPYSQGTGTGWYLSGSTATISVADSTVAVTGGTYSFTGWTGVGTGSYSGNQISYSMPVSGPITETATWSWNPSQPNPLGIGPLVGTNIAILALIFTLTAIGILGVVVVLVLATRRRQK